MAKDPIDVIFRFRVKEGQEDRYQRASDAILSVTETQEPYVLEYKTYRDAEGVYTQHERYVDEEALYRHMEVNGPAEAEWAEATELEQVIVLGDMSARFWNLYGGPHARGYSLVRMVQR